MTTHPQQESINTLTSMLENVFKNYEGILTPAEIQEAFQVARNRHQTTVMLKELQQKILGTDTVSRDMQIIEEVDKYFAQSAALEKKFIFKYFDLKTVGHTCGDPTCLDPNHLIIKGE